MNNIFFKIISMSISAGFVIAAVIVLRLVFKKVPKWIMCLLWALVAVKLICPITFESKAGVAPSIDVIQQNIEMRVPYRQHVAEPSDTVDIPVVTPIESPEKKLGDIPSMGDAILSTLPVIWILGMVILAVHAAVSYINVKKSVSASVYKDRDVKECDELKGAFILGIFRPVIYIPSGMSEEHMCHVLAHERAHIRRLDHLWKAVGYIVLVIHWFNPLCWLAYDLFGKDMEMACDERAVAKLSNEERASYAQTLLDMSLAGRREAVPLAFGKVGTKMRIKRIVNYKKAPVWAMAAALVVVGVIIVVSVLNSPKTERKETASETTVGNDVFTDAFF